MPPVIIRTARGSDADAVSALLAASYGGLLAGDYSPAELTAALPLMARANPALLASGTYYVAEADGGDIVACGGWTLDRPGTGGRDPGVGHIRHFATHPQWTRRGIARAVLDRCIAEADAAGIHTLECFATLTAEHFYAAAGFVAIERITVPLAATVHFPAVHMVRRDG